jgi:hypothetical protein
LLYIDDLPVHVFLGAPTGHGSKVTDVIRAHAGKCTLETSEDIKTTPETSEDIKTTLETSEYIQTTLETSEYIKTTLET